MQDNLHDQNIIEIAKRMIIAGRSQGLTDDQILQTAQQTSIHKPESYIGGGAPYIQSTPLPSTSSAEDRYQYKKEHGRQPRQGSSSSSSTQEDGMSGDIGMRLVGLDKDENSNPKERFDRKPRQGSSSSSSTQEDGMSGDIGMRLVGLDKDENSNPKERSGKKPRPVSFGTQAYLDRHQENNPASSGAAPWTSSSPHADTTTPEGIAAASANRSGGGMPTSNIVKAEKKYQGIPSQPNPAFAPGQGPGSNSMSVSPSHEPTAATDPRIAQINASSASPSVKTAAIAAVQSGNSSSASNLVSWFKGADSTPQPTQSTPKVAPKPKYTASGGAVSANPHETAASFPPPATTKYKTEPVLSAKLGKSVAF